MFAIFTKIMRGICRNELMFQEIQDMAKFKLTKGCIEVHPQPASSYTA